MMCTHLQACVHMFTKKHKSKNVHMLKQIITCSYINSTPQLKHGEIQQIKI